MQRAVLSDQVRRNEFRIVQEFRPIPLRDANGEAVVGLEKVAIIQIGRVKRTVCSMAEECRSQSGDVDCRVAHGRESQIDWNESCETSSTIDDVG